LAPLDGFIWAVTTGLYGLPIYGFGRYSRSSGEMRHRLLDVVTVVSATGADITRSAAARHLITAPATRLLRD
jgi:hypothetical protein